MSHDSTNHILAIGDLLIKKDSREVFIKSQRVHLRRKEYDLLEFFALNPERALNRLTILEYVWSYHLHIQTNTLEAHINSLRRKLKNDSGKNMIRTIHGIGYALNIEKECRRQLTVKI